MHKRIEVAILTVLFGQFLVLFALFFWDFTNNNPPTGVEQVFSGRIIKEYYPNVVFQKISGNKTDLWQTDIDGQNQRQLTHNNNIYDFTISRDGEKIIYSVFNEDIGVDLWEVDRGGQVEQKIVNCGGNWCTQPDISPDGRYVAYSEKRSEETLAESIIKIYDLQNKTTFPLEVLSSEKGTSPSWSSDGHRLAYFDPEHHLIRVVHFSGGEDEIKINTGYPASVTWSSKKNKFYWLESRSTVQGLVYNFVFVTDLETGKQSQILGQHDLAEFGLPEESPDGQWIAYSVRFPDGGPYSHLFVKNLETGMEKTVTQDLSYIYGGYHWDYSSKMLILQRLKSNSSQAKPEVVIWEIDTSSMSLLAENAARPQWLP